MHRRGRGYGTFACVLEREQLTACLFFVGDQRQVFVQPAGDMFEMLCALDVAACGAGRSSLADEVGNDIVLGVIGPLVRGPLGQRHDPIAKELDAVGTVDLFGREARCLLCKAF